MIEPSIFAFWPSTIAFSTKFLPYREGSKRKSMVLLKSAIVWYLNQGCHRKEKLAGSHTEINVQFSERYVCRPVRYFHSETAQKGARFRFSFFGQACSNYHTIMDFESTIVFLSLTSLYGRKCSH